jgi:hypothetical protein
MVIAHKTLFLCGDEKLHAVGKSNAADELATKKNPMTDEAAVSRSSPSDRTESQLSEIARLAALCVVPPIRRCGLWSEQAPARLSIAKSAER